jgi:adenine-specific DNA glycosylase
MVNIVSENHRNKVLKSKTTKIIEKCLKSPNNQKFVKQLIERGTKILKAPNPAC